MDFTLSDEQEMVRDTARALFERECGIDVLRRAWDDPAAGRALYDGHLADWTARKERAVSMSRCGTTSSRP